MYVKDSDCFVTVQFLENTPPVLSPGQLCEDHATKKIPWQKSDGLAEKPATWRKICFELKGDLGENRATFFSPSELWCLPTPPSIKPEESVVDSAEQEGTGNFAGRFTCSIFVENFAVREETGKKTNTRIDSTHSSSRAQLFTLGQGVLAENAPVIKYHAPKISVTS